MDILRRWWKRFRCHHHGHRKGETITLTFPCGVSYQQYTFWYECCQCDAKDRWPLD